ncbi:MAG: ATP-binding cassette domain-containing protein [Lachnospiraceae bacterium]|nr:ATP-binding cassette domain-containing protein [Lachnospiraceae bacterium]
MSLNVDIRKTVGNFTLETSFETEGECLGILGASGCGKSMTLKCIAGILTPDAGRIVLNGRTLYDSDRRINLPPQQRRVGYLFQDYALFPKMTVAENITIGMRQKPAAEKNRMLEAFVHKFHLEGLEERRPSQLSGGQKQRVALARMLAGEPDALLFDEPFSALDSFLKEQLQFELAHVLQDYGGEALMVTHSRDEVYRFCQSVVILEDGRQVDDGDTKELFRNPHTLTTARLSGCKNFSRAERRGEYRLFAADWNTELTTAIPVPENVGWVGIRAHDFVPVSGEDAPAVNLFTAVPADISEDPFEVSVRMGVNGNDPSRYENLVWWKTERSAWDNLYHRKYPERFAVRPEKVMPLV